jgi:hypothetical protein
LGWTALFLPTGSRELPGIGEQMALLDACFFAAAAAIEGFDFSITCGYHFLQFLHLRQWPDWHAAAVTDGQLDGPDRAFCKNPKNVNEIDFVP